MNTCAIFKTISSFVKELNDFAGESQHTLKLYSRLISKTKMYNKIPVQKHINAFSSFCSANKDSIFEMNKDKINLNIVKYSERVYIDFKHILDIVDTETEKIIWKYFQKIYNLIFENTPNNTLVKKTNLEDFEDFEFLRDIFEKIKKQVNLNSNPVEIISQLINSGLFSELISSINSAIENGDLNIQKLLNFIKKLSTNISQTDSPLSSGLQGENGEGLSDMLNSLQGENGEGLTNMLSSLLQGENGEGLSDMLNSLQGENGEGLTNMLSSLLQGENGEGLSDMLNSLQGENGEGLSDMLNSLQGENGEGLTNMLSSLLQGENGEGLSGMLNSLQCENEQNNQKEGDFNKFQNMMNVINELNNNESVEDKINKQYLLLKK